MESDVVISYEKVGRMVIGSLSTESKRFIHCYQVDSPYPAGWKSDKSDGSLSIPRRTIATITYLLLSCMVGRLGDLLALDCKLDLTGE